MRYAAPYLSDKAEAVIKLNTAIKDAALQFQKLPKDLCNVAVRSAHGLRLADVLVICRDSVVATMAQLTHHRSTTVWDGMQAMLWDMHLQYGVCGQFMVPSASFATHAGNTWVDRVLRAMGTLRVGLLMPSSVYSCVHARLPQVQWAGRKWVSQSYSLKGRDICVLSGPRTEEARRPRTPYTQHHAQSVHTDEQEPEGPGHRTHNTTRRACAPVNWSQGAQDTVHATPDTGLAHR